MLSAPVLVACLHMCVLCTEMAAESLRRFFPPYVIGREEAIFHMAWAGNICLASKTHNDIRTRTHREVYCPNDTARAPLKYLSPAVLGCCVCQPNVCWYPSHYAKCIICHVVGRCLVCGPMDNSQTLQMNVSHNTHGHRAPLPLLLVIPLPHSLPNLLTPPLTDSPPPFHTHHALSKLIHWHFQCPSLSHTLTHSLNHSSAVSQTHFQPLLVFRPLPYILLQQPHTCEAFCGCWSSHKHMFSAVAWFISTENKELILTTL